MTTPETPALVTVREQNGVGLITLAHGKVNALDVELLTELRDAFAEAGQYRALVVSGQGRAFSAGVDLRRLLAGGREYAEEFFSMLHDAYERAFSCPIPVVAAIGGHAIAGGCVLAACADVRIMAAGVIGLPEFRVGVPFPTVTVEIMRHLLGTGLTPVIYGAKNYTPDEAVKRGLVDESCTAGELEEFALQRAHSLASVVPSTFAAIKESLRRPALERIRASAGESTRMAELWTRDDVLAAASAVLAR